MNAMAAVVNYSPPWWVNLFHRLPHFNLQFQPTGGDFRPDDSEYQKVGGENQSQPMRMNIKGCSPA